MGIITETPVAVTTVTTVTVKNVGGETNILVPLMHGRRKAKLI